MAQWDVEEWRSRKKTSSRNNEYESVARFTGHVQLKGLSPRTVESYVCMLRQLAVWGQADPSGLTQEQVRDYFQGASAEAVRESFNHR